MTTDSLPTRYTVITLNGGSVDGQKWTKLRASGCWLVAAGKTLAEAAKAVGVARQTAYTWKARLDEGGIEALRVMATGRPAQLDATQREGLRVALLQGPLAHGFGPAMDAQARTGAHRAAVRRYL